MCKALDHTHDLCPEKQKSIQVVENEVIIDYGIRNGSMEKGAFDLHFERQVEKKRKENREH
jgi:hypothetical protein